MAAVFSRYRPAQNRTFALRLLNDHETEINEHFWSFKVISEWAAFQARTAKKTNPKFSTATLFHASGPDSRRVPPTVTDWLGAREELENWLRISALVSASSFLEVYFRQVVRTALMSDPLLQFGAARALDGLVLVKSGVEVPYNEHVIFLTKGDWESRVSAYKSLFGSAPSVLTNRVSTLEKIRKLRNEFAHGFGASVDSLPPTALTMKGRQKISQQAFISYIGAISKVAAAVDTDLSKNLLDHSSCYIIIMNGSMNLFRN